MCNLWKYGGNTVEINRALLGEIMASRIIQLISRSPPRRAGAAESISIVFPLYIFSLFLLCFHCIPFLFHEAQRSLFLSYFHRISTIYLFPISRCEVYSGLVLSRKGAKTQRGLQNNTVEIKQKQPEQARGNRLLNRSPSISRSPPRQAGKSQDQYAC